MTTTAQLEAPWEDGDPDPTPYGNSDEVKVAGLWCGLRDGGTFGWVCTREADHPRDWHVAGDGETICAVWPDTRAHTPRRSVRIPDALWHDARSAAADNGETVTDVITEALRRYVRRNAR